MIIPIGVVRDIDQVVGELGCKVGSFSSTYLGLPLRARFNAVSEWKRNLEES